LKKAKNPKDWSLESRGIAVEKAYLHGELKGGTDKDTAVELPEGTAKRQGCCGKAGSVSGIQAGG
jgi:hypothetical protein